MNLIRTVILFFLILNFQPSYSQNKIWGMTALGGNGGFGVIFTTSPDGSNYQVVHHFDSTNGSIPESKLIKAANGKFYGTTLSGGAYNDGVLFEIDQNGNYKKKVDFQDATTGSRIQGGLALAPNGKLYGATWSGGSKYSGTIFKYDIENHSLTKIADLDYENTSAHPYGSLVLAYNGKLYGTSYGGGTHGLGTIFEVDPATDVVTQKFEFTPNTGDRPAFNMTLAPNGKLYGTCAGGASNGFGSLFVFDPTTGSCEKLHDFDGPQTGSIPIGTLTLGFNGKLYGTTSWGGEYNNGILFEFDYRNQTITKRFDFDEIETGKAPRGGLLQSSNGKLYGTTEQGGMHSQGVIFEFNPYNGNFSKKLDFSLPNGGQPQSCEMTLLGNYDRAFQSIQFDAMQTLDVEKSNVDLTGIASSGLPLVYYSSDESVASVSENKLILHKIGSVSITATQNGNESYHAAADVSRVFSIDSVAREQLITGIEDIPDLSFDVVVKENPFRSNLRFQVNTIHPKANIVLYSMKGDRVHESVQQSNVPVNLQLDFKPGLYLLGVQTPQGRKVMRVVCME